MSTNLQKKYDDLRKKALALEYHLDEGINLMTSLSKRITQLENAIKEHKYKKEQSDNHIVDYDENLYDILEEEPDYNG